MTDTIEIDGREYTVRFEYDDDRDPPWDREDGHGPVRKSSRPHGSSGDKRPGERPLNNPDWHESQFYYDWQAACKEARRDGWNAYPLDAPNRIQRAVQADFDYLRQWLNNDWHYLGVIVTDPETGESESLWGVESFKDYHKEVAREIAQGLHDAHLKAQEQELIDVERRTFPVSAIGI